MPDLLLLAPDALLILCGFLLCRHTALNRPVWDGVERLVYYLLFPALLFGSIVRTPLRMDTSLALGGAGMAVVLAGAALAYGLRLWSATDPLRHASGAQVAFRFNTYVALAVSERLLGAEGLAGIALIVALCVPLANVAAVWPLARQGGQGYLVELLRNPLILATASGLLANLLGLRLPDMLGLTLHRIGLAALPLGLMAVGAGLRLGAIRADPRLALALLAIRHAALPALGLLLGHLLQLPQPQRLLLLAFAAMPTASSAYVLAVRMGGDGGFVAGLVTLSTLLGMLSLPLWLALL